MNRRDFIKVSSLSLALLVLRPIAAIPLPDEDVDLSDGVFDAADLVWDDLPPFTFNPGGDYTLQWEALIPCIIDLNEDTIKVWLVDGADNVLEEKE